MGGMLLCVLVVFMLFGLIAIFLPQSRFPLKFSRSRYSLSKQKPSQDSAHGVGSSWGFDLLCLLGVRHSGEVSERDVLDRFLVCLMMMRFPPLWALQIFHYLGWTIDCKHNFSRWWLEGTTSTRSPLKSTSSQPSPSTWTSSTSSCTSSGPTSSLSRPHLVDGDFPRFVGAARSN